MLIDLTDPAFVITDEMKSQFEVERRKGDRRKAQQPYDGPNQRSRTSRRADELEALSSRERHILIDSLYEESLHEA